jgi:hypothetical protein
MDKISDSLGKICASFETPPMAAPQDEADL